MKPLWSFIVKVDKKFSDEIELSNGNKLFVDTRFNPENHRAYCGEIVAIPEGVDSYGAKVGDTLYFHHHVILSEGYCIDKENSLYMVKMSANDGYENHGYLIKRPDGTFKCLVDFLFVTKKRKQKEQVRESGLIIPDLADVPENEGKIAFDSDRLQEYPYICVKDGGFTSKYLEVGDLVGYEKDSDMTFIVDGEVYYRMRFRDLLYVKA